MKDIAKRKAGGDEATLAHLLDSIGLSSREMASAKARMDQAEAIADGVSAVVKAVGAAFAGAWHGSQVLARRIKSAFMKPAHR